MYFNYFTTFISTTIKSPKLSSENSSVCVCARPDRVLRHTHSNKAEQNHQRLLQLNNSEEYRRAVCLFIRVFHFSLHCTAYVLSRDSKAFLIHFKRHSFLQVKIICHNSLHKNSYRFWQKEKNESLDKTSTVFFFLWLIQHYNLFNIFCLNKQNKNKKYDTVNNNKKTFINLKGCHCGKGFQVICHSSLAFGCKQFLASVD